MTTCDVQALLNSASCFDCLQGGEVQLVKLALLSKILLALNPAADVSPQSLLNGANCFACYGNVGTLRLIELQLICQTSQAA